MDPIIRFSDERAMDPGVVGGKAASLGRLVKFGFPVPPGFTVSTDAHSMFLERDGLADRIIAKVAELDYDDAQELESKTAGIRQMILESPLPGALHEQIISAYRSLGDSTLVAVRSSGTAEDLDEASFAGMHDTYLDIQGEESVLDAVKRCWASMWTARATAYRHAGGFDQDIARLAVVIQTMVASEVSGVMFTANPSNRRTDEIIINASWGLGEGIVSGILTPDEYVLAVHTLDLKQLLVGEKEKIVVRDPETGVGTVTLDTPAADRTKASLTDPQVQRLAALGRDIMRRYGGLPQDIEWAYAGDEFYVLQARPVTGAEFTGNEDVGGWQPAPDDEKTAWA